MRVFPVASGVRLSQTGRVKFALLALLILGTLTDAVGAAVGSAPPRVVPPLGIRIADTDADRLGRGTLALDRDLEALRVRAKSDAHVLEHLPDVEVFHHENHGAPVQ